MHWYVIRAHLEKGFVGLLLFPINTCAAHAHGTTKFPHFPSNFHTCKTYFPTLHPSYRQSQNIQRAFNMSSPQLYCVCVLRHYTTGVIPTHQHFIKCFTKRNKTSFKLYSCFLLNASFTQRTLSGGFNNISGHVNRKGDISKKHASKLKASSPSARTHRCAYFVGLGRSTKRRACQDSNLESSAP